MRIAVAETLARISHKQDLRKNHFKRGIPEVLNEVVIQQAMFERVGGTTGLCRQLFESAPEEQGTAEGVAAILILTMLRQSIAVMALKTTIGCGGKCQNENC